MEAQRRGNPIIPLCHSRENGNLSSEFLFVFLHFSLSLRTFEESVAIPLFTCIFYFFLSLRAPLWVHGNPYLPLQDRIYQGVAISSSYISQHSLFFRHKNYKKTIIIT